MQSKQGKIEVTVEEVRESAPGGADGVSTVVIETEATVNGERRDTSIEVRDTDAPAVAAALLNTEPTDTPPVGDLPVAVQCIAVGVVHAATEGKVRLHLQFDSGQVLPIELPHDAAAALARALTGLLPVR